MTLPIPLEWLLFPVMALALYWPCLNGELIYDDMDVEADWKNKQGWRVWKESRPLTILLYRLTHKWPGTLRGHHVTNVLVHSLNAVLVGKIASQIGVNPWIASLLFLAHPFAVNAVAYISGLASLLSASAGLFAISLSLSGHWSIALAAIAVAAMAKPDGIALSLTLLAISLQTGPPRFAEILSALILIGGVAGFLYFRKHYQPEIQARAHIKDGLPGPLPQPEHAMTVLTHTLRLLPAWALGLCIANKHGGGIETRLEDEVLAVLSAVGLGALTVIFPVPMSLILFGPWLVYIVFRIHEPLAEYRNYAMVAGFALLLSQSYWGLVAIGWFAYQTYRHAYIYRTASAFWTSACTVGLGDKSNAYYQLAGVYQIRSWKAKDEAEMKMWLEKAANANRFAIGLNPALAPARCNLARVLTAFNENEALFEFEKSVIQCPHYEPLWEELAHLYQSRGALEKADHAITKALDLAPSSASILNRAGIIRYLRRRLGEARQCFRQAVELDPNPYYRVNLAITQRTMGDTVKAEDLAGLPKNLPVTNDLIPPQMQEVHA